MKDSFIHRDFIHRGLGLDISRRRLLQGGAGIVGGSLLPAMPAFAENTPAIGTYPAGVSGSSPPARWCSPPAASAARSA